MVVLGDVEVISDWLERLRPGKDTVKFQNIDGASLGL